MQLLNKEKEKVINLNNLQSSSKVRRHITKVLLVVVLSISLYLIVYPFYPQLSLRIAKYKDKTQGYKYESNLAKETTDTAILSSLKPKPLVNTLVIPQIGIDTAIVEGTSEKTLDKGIWRKPNGSSPEKGGNTVLTGHRFQYTSGSNTFYHLDKIKVGDKFMIFWEGKEYDYEVFETLIVKPEHIEIENDTEDSIVTLYTCTPLWTSKDRLVVKGKLIT